MNQAALSIETLNRMMRRQLIRENNSVKSFSFKPIDAQNSESGVVTLEYTNPPSSLPKSVFYKTYEVDEKFIPDSEIKYYLEDYTELENSPIPHCYFGAVENGRCVLLLEDLSSTHSSNKDVAPTKEHAVAVGRELARLHAYKWKESASFALEFDQFVCEVRKSLEDFLNSADFLSADDKKIIASVFSQWPKAIRERLKNSNGLTLIHGDANPTNVLSPISGSGKTYVIDRQPFTWSLRKFMGVSDLAYMIVPFWDTDMRRKHESTAINSYCASLQEFGVKNYDLSHCMDDYRLSIPLGIFTAVSWAKDKADFGKMAWLWKLQIERSLQAYKDHDCGHIIDEFILGIKTNALKPT